MAEGPDNTTGKWQQLKTKFLSLTFRTQVLLAIGVVALIAVIAVTATIVIDVGNPTAVPGVTIRFEPVNRESVPGQTLRVDMVIDTQGRYVSAVQAVFVINDDGEPLPRLELDCTSTLNCPGIDVSPAWGTIAELSRIGDTVTIAVGTNSLVSGNGIVVATIDFTIPMTAPYGQAEADFDPTLSAIIANDGQGTNIIDTVQSEDWDIVENLTNGSIQITSGPSSSVDPCGPPFPPPFTSSEVTITWETNEEGDSNVKWRRDPCPTCAWGSYDDGSGGTIPPPPQLPSVTNHEVVISGLPGDTLYYYKTMSTSDETGDWIVSGQGYFYTGCGVPTGDDLIISNLSVTPSARLALVTWNTNLLADSRVFDLFNEVNGVPGMQIPPDVAGNNRGDDNFFDPTVTLSHSLTIPSLEPSTDYCIDVSSTTPPPVPAPPGNYDSDNICFKTESEDLSLDANIVLKVERDRVCDQWLSCASSVEVEDILGERRDLCFDYALCEELDVENNGECTKMISAFTPGGGSALEFNLVAGSSTLSSIGLAKNLTGYSKVGANWRGLCSDNGDYCFSDVGCTNNDCVGVGPNEAYPAGGTVSGYFPVPNMSQLGSSAGIVNGDFEAGFAYPWQPRQPLPPDQMTEVQIITDRTVLAADFNQVLSVRRKVTSNVYTGALIPLGNSLRAGTLANPVQYYVAFDVRTADERFDKINVQFGFKCKIEGPAGQYNYEYRPSGLNQYDDEIPLSTGWQRVLAGPLEIDDQFPLALGEETCLALLVKPTSGGGNYQPFYVDNIQIQPVLWVKPGGADVSPESHISRSCRQYPSADAPVCRYFDTNSGRELQGWEGYCLQTDPRNERRCIQWVPIDLIAGSSPALAAYGQAGYGIDAQDRLPLYYCTESRGNAPYTRLVGVTKPSIPDLRLLCMKHPVTRECTGGWGSSTGGVINFNMVADVKGRILSKFDNNVPTPLYIYDIEQIKIDITGAQAWDWPTGEYFLNRDNGFERVLTKNCWACPNNESDMKDPENVWYWRNFVANDDNCQGLAPGNEANLVGIQAVFDEDTGVFKGFEAGLCDDSEGHGYVNISVYFYLREWCTEIAQVVDPFGSNTAWAERVHSNLYSVPGLGYQRNREYTPFGGIVAPEPDYDPSKWDYSEQERDRQPMMIEPADKQNFPTPPHQARVSSPYGGSGSCNLNYIKVGRAICVSGDRAKVGESCASNADCGYGADQKAGRCTGVVPPGQVDEDEFFSALECPQSQNPPLNSDLASYLFARSEQEWIWDFGLWKYKIDPDPLAGWDVTKPSDGYAKPPRIENYRIKGGSGHTINTNGDIEFKELKFGKVTITFNSVVDPEQVPLTRYTVDWGDDSASEESNMKIAPQSSLPHVLTHTYSCPKSGPSCTFTPRVQIEDNWNWCSGTPNSGGTNYSGDGTACNSWDYLRKNGVPINIYFPNL